MPRFICERRVQGNEVRAAEQIIQFVHQLDLQTARAGGGEIWIIGNHPHAESDGTPAQLTSDAPHPDYAERFVIKLDAFKIFSFPISLAHTCISLWNFARDTEQE